MTQKIKKVINPYAWETLQSRIDEAIVTGQPLVERPFWYENIETGQLYHELYGCIGWPTEVSETDEGRPGYVAVVGIVKSKKDKTTKEIEDAPFLILAEASCKDVPQLLEHVERLRYEYGFGLHPGLMESWIGDPERYITMLALRNERLMRNGGENAAILIAPPDDFYNPHAFDIYSRTLLDVLSKGRQRLFYGRHEILKDRLPVYHRDDPTVFAMGGLVHSLLVRCTWMDQAKSNAFVVEEGL